MQDQSIQKRCCTCGTIKPIDAFGVARNQADGHNRRCRVCRHVEYLRDRPAILAKRAEYRATNIDAIRQRGREYGRKNRPRLSAYHHAYRTANAEQLAAANREWRATHVERRRINGQNSAARRRARKALVPIERFSILDIADRDRWRCHICGGPVDKRDATMDHLIPLAHGGAHTRANVALAHRACNTKRGPGRIPAQLRLSGE